MTGIEPSIMFYGQWMLFLATSAFGIWGTGYAIWASAQLGYQWYAWLENKRDLAKFRVRIDQSHYESLKRLELQALTATQEMELNRAKANNESLSAAMLQMSVDEGPRGTVTPIKSK